MFVCLFVVSNVCLGVLPAGMVMVKHCRGKAKPHVCRFRVSDDNMKLLWTNFRPFSRTRQVPLASVTEILCGQETPVFRNQGAGAGANNNGPTAEERTRSFSLITTNRSVDIVAPTAEAQDLWLTGISRLVQLLTGKQYLPDSNPKPWHNKKHKLTLKLNAD